MGIFDTFKKMLKGEPKLKDVLPSGKANMPANVTTPAIVEPKKSVLKQGHYIKKMKKNRYDRTFSFTIPAETEDSWDKFFTVNKENPKFIGFNRRSRRKFRHLYHNEQVIVAEEAKTIEVVRKNSVKKFFYKDTALEKFRCIEANEHGTILHQNNNSKVAFINHSTGAAYGYEFKWNPFSFAIGNDFWLVGTRETLVGPGELYCFNFNGEQLWAITFNENFDTAYGNLTLFPYTVEVSKDSTGIFVSSMDRLYRLDPSGNLQARIAVSDLKQKDFDAKVKNLEDELSRKPKNQDEAISILANQMVSRFSLGFEAASITSPFSDFAHDPETDMLFAMEEQGRISAWDQSGQLVWVNTFKKPGTYIEWLDGKLVSSFETGETLWMDRNGTAVYGGKLPMQVIDISLIPNKETYIVVCKDHRLYELNKKTGEFIKGTEGSLGMKLFNIAGQNIFFDGEKTGYFWLAPEGIDWTHFEAKNFTETDDSGIDSGVAPEITATTPFTDKQVLQNEDSWYGGRIIDVEKQRIYVVEKGSRADYSNYPNITKAQQRKDQLSHYLSAYQFDGTEVWKLHLYSGMWSLYDSPDKDVIFTSAPTKDEITYEPGVFYIISNEGKILTKQKVQAHGFYMEFLSNSKGIIRFRSEKGSKGQIGIVVRDQSGKWHLTIAENLTEEEIAPFGAGLDFIETPHFKLERTDKKKYTLHSGNASEELSLKAAVYEAVETLDNAFVLRSGKRSVLFYDQGLAKGLELKEAEDIKCFAVGNRNIVVVTKSEIHGYSLDGKCVWKYSAIPKTTQTQVAWYPEQEVFLWEVSNSHKRLVASIKESGEVVKSQSFNANDYHRDTLFFPEKGVFSVQTNGEIKILNAH
ncbi:ornithine cyclodeaminase [Rossellomorea marisflavi]|uniref:ornithine cyclodeaminase n=1 Tax=Rossellomorea marisflavi TaxID=189381 RepID=UPI0034590662